jgi:hypothetical protein
MLPAPRLRFIRRSLLFIIPVLLSVAGCSDTRDRLVIATWWPLQERVQVESEFRRWLEGSGRQSVRRPLDIQWRLVGGWDHWERELARRDPPDVLLGGSAESLGKLASDARLRAGPDPGAPPYLVIRTGEIRLVDSTDQLAHLSEPPQPAPDEKAAQAGPATAARRVTFDDPRRDPVSRAWAVSLLDSQHFREGYAELVQTAGNSRRIGWLAGSARAAVASGQVQWSPVRIAEHSGLENTLPRSETNRPGGSPRQRPPEAAAPPRLVECAAILSGARNEATAGQFLRFLADTYPGEPVSEIKRARSQPDREVDELAADLVGAIMVDAQDELWAAWAALDRTRQPKPALKWMTEPPPWPPASVGTLLATGGSDALDLVEALAREIAPDAAIRAGLVRSWHAPARVIDRSVLTEITRIADGRLVAEPRFRAWLCAEWTTWARQRFRRVGRLATSAGSESRSAK